MHPIFQTVLAVIVGASYFVLQEGEPRTPLSLLSLDPFSTAALTFVLSLVPLPVGAWFERRVRRELRGEPRGGPARRTGRAAARRFRSLPVLLFPIQVWVIGWPEIVNVLGIKGWVLVDKLVLILPFAIALVLSWIPAQRFEALSTGHATPLSKYVGYNLRMAALPCLPILAFITATDTVELIEPIRLQFEYQPYLVWLLMLAFGVVAFIFFPLTLRLVRAAESLPRGPLRDRLESFARATRFRFRDILVWNTGGRIVNAAVLGLVGRYRYVVLSDGLVAALKEEEVLPVFAHEVGHAKHHHVLLYLFFSLSYVCVLYVLYGAFLGRNAVALDSHPVLVLSGVLALFAVYWGLVFGFLFRRFELEADVFAAEALGDTAILVDTLERLSKMSTRTPAPWSWRHFSIANRVDFLTRYRTDPVVRRRFRFRLRILVGSMVLALCAGVALAARGIREEREFALGRIARRAGHFAEAQARFRAAIVLDDAEPRFWIALGDAYYAERRREDALECVEKARKLGPLADSVKRELESLEKKIAAGPEERPQPTPGR